MSTTSKHFGLSYREESYIFKELEKIRRETKKDFLQFKQKLASKPAVDEVPVCSLQAPGPAWSQGKRGVSCAGPQKPSGFPRAKGPAPPTAARQQALGGALRPRGPSEGAAPWKTQPFRPQEFYLRSSAFLRHRPPKLPQVIASKAGTSRPVVLVPPSSPRRKPAERRVWRSPRPSNAKPALDPVQEPDARQQPALPAEDPAAERRTSSSISSQEDDSEAAIQRRRVRILTHYMREGSSRSFSKTDVDSVQPSNGLEAALQAPLPVRVIPKSIEEIIASLQSEAQLASDQTIKELIQSVLGQNYDIKMELDGSNEC
uniref:Tetratricopeptide repeat domain 6 n=1 Tax=Molossus molossus TaxID=27622 RepID=A0A7J8K3A3_MOLMO|nr:tetratricopeptide repeat domain 6 [Molossus molossus]